MSDNLALLVSIPHLGTLKGRVDLDFNKDIFLKIMKDDKGADGYRDSWDLFSDEPP